MKRISMALAFLATIITTTSFATERPVSETVKHSFEQKFSTAQNVSWSQVGDLYKVTFAVNGIYSSAFYNADGGLVAVAEYIAPSQLPDGLQQTLLAKAKDYKLIELFCISNNGHKDYYATFDNGQKQMVLKAGSKKWVLYLQSGQ